MTKRIFGIVILVIALMMVFSCGAFAKDVLESIDFEVLEPYAGMTADFSAKAKSDDYFANSYRNYYDNGQYENGGVEWYDLDAQKYLEPGDKFVKGHHYKVKIFVTVKSDAPEIHYSRGQNDTSIYYYTKGTVNGKSGSLWIDYNADQDRETVLSYTFLACTEITKKVNEVNINGVTYPTVGQTPDNIAGYEEGKLYRVADFDQSPFENGVNWYRKNGNYQITQKFDAPFTVNQKYTVSVLVETVYPYAFAPDVDATLNGRGAVVKPAPQGFAPERYRLVEYTFDYCQAAVSHVDITMNQPAKGHFLDETPDFGGLDCTLGYIAWYKNGAFLWEDDFVPPYERLTEIGQKDGDVYKVVMWVKAPQGMNFAVDGKFDPAVTVSVNGTDATVRKAYEQEAAKMVEVEYTFPAVGYDPKACVHEMEYVPASAWSCTTDRYNAYYHCKKCGENYADKDGKGAPIDLYTWGYEPAGHHWNNGYGYRDEYGHANVCRNCGVHDEPEVHVPGPAATSVQPQRCTVCGMILKEATGTSTPTPTPPSDIPCPFTDVVKGSYYYDAVLWAYSNKITSGTSDTLFSPEMSCTRGQVVTFLWRTAGEPEPKSSVNPFVDLAGTDAYYYKAVLWAAENKITSGVDATHFAPERTCSRSQIVTFLHRYAGTPEPKSFVNPFVDLAGTDAYYYKAVLWAVENKITNGVDATHFAPEKTCSRGQIVTFLYRYVYGVK